jgi:muramoyltetrapeptide carboxypeptidase
VRWGRGCRNDEREMSRTGSSAPLLVRGDTVGVVAPGFAVRPAPLQAGARRLRRMGFRVALGEHVLSRHGYLAGPDEARAEDLRAMIADKDVRAIWFARGGYGTARILDRVPWRTLKRRPILFVGYSDLTALFCAVVQRTGQVCLHGPVVTELGKPGAYHPRSLRRLLNGEPTALRVRGRQVLVEGYARGRLLGGNLTVLTHLLGTRYAPDLRGCVLFLEEVGEEAYRIDRALTHLKMGGAFRRLAGVLVGRCSVPRPERSFPRDRSLRELLTEFFAPLGVPVVTDLPAGHVPAKWTLPLGGTAEIDTGAGEVRFRP